ncbi:MAG: HU family DNA-binding protein [Oscillospiraceae bacterium]|nr:HU family DNA-binding protein [Oscillospiraceae bacterium]
MNKTEFVQRIADINYITPKQASSLLDSILELTMDTVAAGEKLVIPGFGSFEKKHRAGRTGRNPATGEKIMISAADFPAFKPGKTFKDKM